MQIIFLGTGTSTGVPVIGCKCKTCQSDNPHNKRMRSSILVSTETTRILIDSCTDLRAQALQHNITAVDAVIYTHEHLDHTAGFDELRAFCWHRTDKLPIYAGEGCMKQLERMYTWAFSKENTHEGYIRPEGHVHHGEPFCVGDLLISPVLVEHASVQTYGYILQHGDVRFAYISDVKNIPARSMEQLRGLHGIAIDSLGYQVAPHRSHIGVEDALQIFNELAPGQAWITHCGHRVDADVVGPILPPKVNLAYDGLTLNF